MPGKEKLIGVCLSQANSYINAGYISELERTARREGYRIAVFNTTLDFYWYRQGNSIARSVFRAINYDLLSALVVVHESFHDAQLLDQIVREASAHQVPVFCLGAVWEGCISILYDYYEPYKALLRHVIQDHGVRDTFYISGIEGEANSALRVQCYRETLAECGLPWKRENIAYGLFIEGPTRIIVEDLVRTREKLPEAIFCANDYMAMTVCSTLKDHGYRVPEDVKVTGFDGIPITAIYSPQLATCSQDAAALAKRTMELILALARGETVDPVQHHLYRSLPAESCGCPAVETREMDALTLFRRMEAQNDQENHLYQSVERMLMQENMRDLLLILSHVLPPDSAVYLNGSFLTSEQSAEYDLDRLEPELMRIRHQNLDTQTLDIERLDLRDLALEFGGRPGITIFTAIHSDTTVVGCFAAHTESLDDRNQIIRRMSDVLNMAFTVLLGNVRQKKLLTHLENSAYQDAMTGLPNLKGLSRWFDRYAGDPASRQRCVALSVYNIHRYDYLYETYGISETEEIVRLVGESLRQTNPEACCVARISEKQFAIANDAEDMSGISEIIDRCVRDFFRRIETFNATGGKSFFLEVNCGCTTMDRGWMDASLENLIHLATGEMYLNRMRSGSHEAEKSEAAPDARMYSAFRMLIERNLFHYHFQPIVDAKTGQIVAYEALMRTEPAIGLSPLEILDTAREYNHLYDVERLTLFGIMDRYTRNHGRFHHNRIFINTIPGHFLTREDCDELRTRYENYLDCFVFELTEQETTSDEELARLKQIHKAGGQTQIAIDDFGTGHSNIVNLLRYTPQIIKIDRGLIAGIQNDGNKQLFVRNTIDFAHKNGIQVLAEGVETAEELRVAIDCGADLIQGFYTARPAEEPLDALPEKIRDEILEESLRLAREDTSQRVYQARDGETIHVIDLALQNYTVIQIPGGEVTLIGETAHVAEMCVQVRDRVRTHLILDHVNLQGAEAPIQIGGGSQVTLSLVGGNALHREGIRVPASSSLRITGSGDLEVHNTRNYAAGIGGNYNDPYGTIEIEMDGRLFFRAAGDKVICLGGSASGGEGIRIIRGEIDIEASGVNVLGLGSSAGPAEILAEPQARVRVHAQGNDTIALGTMTGTADLRLRGEIDVLMESERAVGVGTMNGDAAVRLEGGRLQSTLRCDVGACLGSFQGEASLRLRETRVRLHGEGNSVCGLGSLRGSSETRVSSGSLTIEMLAGDRKPLGNEKSRCEITGGNIQIGDPEGHPPVGPGGIPLRYLEPEGDAYRHVFSQGENSWTCFAERDEKGRLGVWIPVETEEAHV